MAYQFSFPLKGWKTENWKIELYFLQTVVSFAAEIKSQFTFWKSFFRFSQVPDKMADCALQTLPHDSFKHQEKQKKQPQKCQLWLYLSSKKHNFTKLN